MKYIENVVYRVLIIIVVLFFSLFFSKGEIIYAMDTNPNIKKRQDAAPEQLFVKVQKTKITENNFEFGKEFNIEVIAVVKKIMRSESSLSVNSSITVVYKIREYLGPIPPCYMPMPKLNIGTVYHVFLQLEEGNNYTPAAGPFSFVTDNSLI